MKNKMRKALLLFFTASFVMNGTPYFVCGANMEGENITIEDEKEGQQKEYKPDYFSWSGGTGRVTISCDKLVEKDGVTYGEIVFSSDAYAYIKVGDETYYALSNEGCSVFEIPVEINTNMEILAMTTRMSAAHEIKYQLYIEYGNPHHEEENMVSDMQACVTEEENELEEVKEISEISEISDEKPPVFEGLNCISKMDLKYAQCFDVYHYASDESKDIQYSLIDIHGVARYFVVEEDEEIPKTLDSDIIVLQKPLDHIYLAATSAMSLFDSLDALSNIRLSGTDASGWYIENAVEKMESGDILYAGKYSEPDYELLLSEGCDLAIESTMIQHAPKVKEMIEDLGIPVVVDYSSYESHPLGRTEWIKLYSVLTGKEEEGKAFFDKQAEIINRMEGFENTEKTVAFFYVSTDGKVVVRSTEDYIPKMIEIAGGRYAFDNLESTKGKQSSVSMTMEEFYNTAIDADYLIYNASIDSPVETLEELMTKSELFADFKAVKEGNVWGTDKYLYQATDVVGNMIEDIHLMLTDGNEEDMTFIFKIK